MDALVVVAGERLSFDDHPVADHPHVDALALAQQRAHFAHQLLGVLPADHDQIAEARVVGAPDQQGGAALSHAGDQQLAPAADLLDVGDLRLADGDAGHVAGLDHFLLPDAERDDGAIGLTGGGRGKEQGKDRQASHLAG